MLWILTGLTASAGELDLGVGVRNSISEDGIVEGARLLGRWSRGAISLEGQLYATPVTERISELDETLVRIGNSGFYSSFVRTVGVDRVTGSVLFTHRLIPHAESLSAGPAFFLGGELGQQVVYTVSSDGNDGTVTTKDGTRLLSGPIGGVGLEVVVQQMTGRLCVLDRVRVIDGEFIQEPTLTLDVMWRL